MPMASDTPNREWPIKMIQIEVNVESRDEGLERHRLMLTRYPRWRVMLTRAYEYRDLTDDDWQLKKTERGLLHWIDLNGTIGKDCSTSVRQVIRTRDRLRNQDCHAGRRDQADCERDGKYGLLRALTGGRRWPFNVVLSAFARTTTAPFMHARAQVVRASKKGRARQ
jgi:hypothetical protein